MTDWPALGVLSRRRLTFLAIGGALAGASWTTGMAVIARGWRPRISVLGDEGWQVLLIEHGSNRILVLSGTFDESPAPATDLLCGLLRQHIDVVAGAGDALALLPSGFRDRRAVSTTIRLDPPSGLTSSPAYLGLSEAINVRAGAMEITLEPLSSGAWASSTAGSASWIGHLTVRGLTVAFGPALDVVASRSEPQAALAIAPRGDAARLWRMLPGIAVATNARESLVVHVPEALVRTFPEDIAMFEFKDGRLTVPDWAERAERGPADS